MALPHFGKSVGKEDDGSGKNGIEERGEDRNLFLHESIKRGFPVGDLFETLFPFRRGDGVFEYVWSHVDERLAERRRDQGLAVWFDVLSPLERLYNAGTGGFRT